MENFEFGCQQPDNVVYEVPSSITCQLYRYFVPGDNLFINESRRTNDGVVCQGPRFDPFGQVFGRHDNVSTLSGPTWFQRTNEVLPPSFEQLLSIRWVEWHKIPL